MAGAVHISEAEASRDLSALVDRVLAGEEIVVRREGRDVVKLLLVGSGLEPPRKTLGEVIEGLRLREQTMGFATMDDEFPSDMEKIHTDLNAPMDQSLWD